METKKDILEHIQMKPRTGPGADYFEGLAQTVLARTGKEEAVIVPLYKKPVMWISGAAAAVLVIFATGLFNAAHPTSGFESITAMEAAAYIEDHMDAFDEDLLAEFVFEESAAPVQQTVYEDEEMTAEAGAEKAELFSDLSEEEVLDYLEEEQDLAQVEYYY